MIENQTVKFITLGCKVNQYETQGMREILQKSGVYSLSAAAEGAANYIVINTCTVTADADRESRYWIRRARREHPDAKIIVTGCGVERNHSEFESLPEVDLILKNHEKTEIVSRLALGCGAPQVQAAATNHSVKVNPKHVFSSLSISETEGGGRAFIKIQDGCNHACSFCKVVLVRGRSRSRNLSDIVDEVKRLRDSGYREIVFAGIQLGAYGLDFQSPALRLPEVLEACAQVEGIERLRLSSIEPTDVQPELIEALKGISKCCPQLHIPLQSGDDEILKAMNRRYTRDFYADLVLKLRSDLSDFMLTLDVMTGFPGETELNFQNTADLLKKVRPLKCHVFPYSRREGTKAAHLTDLPAGAAKERGRKLIQLAETLSASERLPYLGKTLLVLAESCQEKNGLLQGMTANYLKVSFPGAADQIGQMMPVRLDALHGEGFMGNLD